jgi:hypothetical protein
MAEVIVLFIRRGCRHHGFECGLFLWNPPLPWMTEPAKNECQVISFMDREIFVMVWVWYHSDCVLYCYWLLLLCTIPYQIILFGRRVYGTYHTIHTLCRKGTRISAIRGSCQAALVLFSCFLVHRSLRKEAKGKGRKRQLSVDLSYILPYIGPYWYVQRHKTSHLPPLT